MALRETLKVQPAPDAAKSYEDARRQLSRALTEFSDDLANDAVEPHTTIQLAARRAAVIEEGLRFFGPLRRFIQHEIERWTDPTAIDADLFSIDDIVASTYLSAVNQADAAPEARAFYTWLRRIARREAREAVLEQEAHYRIEQSLYAPVATVSTVGEWPDHVVRLISILADPRAQLPEDILIQRETWDALRVVLQKLPEQWREVFLLSVVDGWSDAEIATAEGIEVRTVRSTVESSRAFLRDWLQNDVSLAALEGAGRG